MNLCLKMILMNFISVSVFSLGIFSENAHAQFRGCHNFCGRESNDAWWNYMRSQGLNEQSTREQKAPHTAAADDAKDARYSECMQQTLDEGKTSEAECNGEQSQASVPTPTANPNRCQTEYSNLVQQCEAEVSAAQSSCDEKNSPEIESAKSQASAAASNTSASIADSCKNAQALSSSAQSALTNYRDQCSSGISQCHSKCGELLTWADNNASCLPMNVAGQNVTKNYIDNSVYTPKLNQCTALQAKVDDANSSISSYAANSSSSSQCQSQTSGGAGGGGGQLGELANMAAGLLQKQDAAADLPVPKTFCEVNPTAPACTGGVAATNCSDPAVAATNKVCICAANPRSPQCFSESSSSSASSIMAGGNIDSSSRVTGQPDTGPAGDIPGLPSIPMGARPSGGDSQGIDGSQGGGSVGESTVGSGGGPFKKAAVGVNDEPLPPGPGGYGGGGRGGGGKFAGSPGATNYGSTGSRPASGTLPPGVSSAPDLRQFLPGGMRDPRARGIAGAVGIDGITGPHTNIWEKVQNRYRVLQDSLHP